jgi:hypothetical protein
MIKPFLSSVFVLSSLVTFSQSNIETENNTSKKLRTEFKIQSLKTKNSGYQNSSESVAKTSYNNWEREILDAMIVSEIPKEFPKYSPEMTDEQYKATIISWANANPSLFKQ